MLATQTFRHDNYELTCSAEPRDNGSFESALVITKMVWPTRPRRIAMARGTHPTESAAIEAAYAQGVAWIKDFG